MSYFGQRKTCKSESIDKTSYTIHYPHTRPESQRVPNDGFYQIISIDPGRKNYALRIDRTYIATGTCTRIAHEKFPIEEVTISEDGERTFNMTYRNLRNRLNQYRPYYGNIDYVLIERQLAVNYRATRIMQATIDYYENALLDTPTLPTIIEIDPKVKVRVFKPPKGIDQKKWTVPLAIMLLQLRGDHDSVRELQKKGKNDDKADVVSQKEAFLIEEGLSNIDPDALYVENIAPLPNFGLLDQQTFTNAINTGLITNGATINVIADAAPIRVSMSRQSSTSRFRIVK